MNVITRYVLLARVIEQCDYALLAGTNIVSALRQWKPASPEDAKRRHLLIWFHVQAFVVAVGNVAKILNPRPVRATRTLPRQEAERRTEEMERRAASLRTELGISDDSIILSKQVRNRFEHYDEHVHALDVWGQAPHFDIIDKAIVPPGFIRIQGKKASYLRAIDPQTLTISFLDQPMPGSIPDYLRELSALRDAATAMQTKLSGPAPAAESDPEGGPADHTGQGQE
ncbi:hypothetical protein [Arenibaculum pallidiluteum]|uniref:hypothetical protein n=1 Tax=Arenibaculum pallidiluteum TaxID=2812559 RepID=UPI001A963526|nr:hypothetical protein [Arenibaculum pallidiluteum]